MSPPSSATAASPTKTPPTTTSPSTPGVQPIAVTDGRVRVVIESVKPAVDGGRFPIKRVTGEPVVVEADCFADGHDVVACELLWRREPDTAWMVQPMLALGNDRWRASFTVDAIGRWSYTVRAWVDPFLSWRHDFSRRIDPDDVRLAALSGASLIGQAAQRAPAGSERDLLQTWADELLRAARSEAPLQTLKALGLDDVRGALAQRHPDRQLAQDAGTVFGVLAERERARFSAWYEFFPRSAAGDGQRHGTFADCETWLPYVKRMGFDVLYFPPIHPVGRQRRKGPNNTLETSADDVGSPWAVGSAEGGHDAILNELGTLSDFQRLLAKARDHELELALDIAFQCAPDHPWVTEHPEWFKKRADGSIQYAENPPKKYQDIYPLDFESPQWPALWQALAGVFEYWAEQGVRIFRVDNPHTKAFPFWEWAITRVRERFPDAIFLSEAFTRPRVMHRLAKVGFSQSYTYFTWRNTKQELTEYFTELSQGPGREYFRPNAWPNTPDILPAALQYGGRPMFMARVALAATLSANYGLYGPSFELLDHRALREGGEEYLDSEKFQLRSWNRDQADSLADFIAVLNRLRRANPALQSDAGLHFLDIDNEQLIAYAKATPDLSNIVVCVVNLDPHHAQSGWLTLDPAALGLPGEQAYQMHDAISDAHYLWHGPRNFISLDPQRSPVHVMELRRHLRRENDFDYFL
jgi:starch synthase (maltosyl-transferring)